MTRSVYLSPEQLERLAKVFESYPQIRAVYLFGSFAEGNAHPDSDLDLAIVPGDMSVRARKLDILTDLARCGFCNVDLILLDGHDIVLAYESVRHNCLVYQTEEFDRGEMYSRIVRQYLDFVPYLDVQRAAYKRRVLLGQNGSRSPATESTR